MRYIYLVIFSVFFFFSQKILTAQSLLKDINPGNALSLPLFLGEANNKLFFTTGNDLIFYKGLQLWSSDSTEQGTQLLLDLGSYKNGFAFATEMEQPSDFSSNYCFINNKMVFLLQNANTNIWEAWTSDGTPGGTSLFMTFGDSVVAANFGNGKSVSLNGKTFFSIATSTGKAYVGTTDGTPSGTAILKKVNSVAVTASYYPFYTMPRGFVLTNNSVHFIGTNTDSLISLWRSDGTAIGTNSYYTINHHRNFFGLIWIKSAGSKIIFSGYDTTNGVEPWVTDGTALETYLLKDMSPGATNTGFPGNFRTFKNHLFFIANDRNHGLKLWVTDGTMAGTRLVKDVSTVDGPDVYALINETPKGILFTGSNESMTGRLWVSDGTETGTYPLPETIFPNGNGFERNPYNFLPSVAKDGRVYFQSFRGASRNSWSDLWSTDGTIAGTKAEIKNDTIYAMYGLDHPFTFAAAHNRIYFSGVTFATGIEPHYLNCPECPSRDFLGIYSNLYPNPSSGKVYIDLKSNELVPSGNAALVIFDATGRRVKVISYQLDYNCTKIEFDVSALSQGTYFAYLLIGNNKISKKFIVIR